MAEFLANNYLFTGKRLYFSNLHGVAACDYLFLTAYYGNLLDGFVFLGFLDELGKGFVIAAPTSGKLL